MIRSDDFRSKHGIFGLTDSLNETRNIQFDSLE